MFKKVFFFITVSALLLMPVFTVHAQYGIDVTAGQTPIKDFQSKSIQTMVGNILGQVLALVGILFFLLMIYGGVTWMTASGNAEKEKKALGTMISATIGIIIVLSAYVLVSFVINKVGQANTTASVAICKPRPEINLSEICTNIYGLENDCVSNAVGICQWLNNACVPQGEVVALCNGKKDEECQKDPFNLICEWK